MYNLRSGDWWEHIVLETFTSREWLENFRLSKDTFDYLCTKLTPQLQYQDTHLRKVITVKKHVAITLRTLASSAEYSVLIQAVVDYKYCFLDIYTGWPGSMHDARVLAHSTFVTGFAKTVPNGTFTKLYFIVLLLCTYFEEIVVQILASYE